MLTGLQWHMNLQEIYIGNNSFTSLGIEALVEVITTYQSLKILSLGNCGVTDQNFIQLSYQLSDLSNLQQLSIQSNLIGDYGLLCFSSLLTTQSLPSLKVLHLGDNPVSGYSLKHFFQALSRNSTLKQIYLNDIAMEIQVIHALSECLQKNTVLYELNLGNTGFSNQAASIIWPALKKSKLQTLQLWNNHLTDDGLLPLLEILEQQTLELTYLGLNDNEIKNEELIKDINEYLKQHEWLEDLPKKIKKQIQQPQQGSTTEEQEEEEQQESQELEDLEQEVQEAKEIEDELQTTENIIDDIEEQNKLDKKEQEENEGNQGKLKTLKWTGEEEDKEDKTLLHSKLE